MTRLRPRQTRRLPHLAPLQDLRSSHTRFTNSGLIRRFAPWHAPAPAVHVPGPTAAYEPRHAAQRVLNRLVLEHFETFRAQAASLEATGKACRGSSSRNFGTFSDATASLAHARSLAARGPQASRRSRAAWHESCRPAIAPQHTQSARWGPRDSPVSVGRANRSNGVLSVGQNRYRSARSIVGYRTSSERRVVVCAPTCLRPSLRQPK